jgi:hypothetical protein
MRRGVSRKRLPESTKAAGGSLRGGLFWLLLPASAYLQILRIGCSKLGGAEGNRTLDLLNAIQALSQLSYGPTQDGEV